MHVCPVKMMKKIGNLFFIHVDKKNLKQICKSNKIIMQDQGANLQKDIYVEVEEILLGKGCFFHFNRAEVENKELIQGLLKSYGALCFINFL